MTRFIEWTMPATLVDYEELSKGQHGQKYLLTLEALRKKVFHIGFALFYILIILYILDLVFGYRLRWRCHSICGESISVYPADLDLSSLSVTCGQSRSQDTLDAFFENVQLNFTEGCNSTLLCQFCSFFGAGSVAVTAHSWNGSSVLLEPLSRFYRAMVVFERPDVDDDGEFGILAYTWYCFSDAAIESEDVLHGCDRSQVFSRCLPGTVNCDGAPVYSLDSPRKSVYNSKAHYSFTELQFSNDTRISTTLERSTFVHCWHRTASTMAGLVLRYCCLVLWVLLAIVVAFSVDWGQIGLWIPEQYWCLGLLVVLLLYINPLYAWLVFWDGEENESALYKFLQVVEYDSKAFARAVVRAFEIVVVCSCQGVQTFLFGFFYVPSLFASLWVGCVVAVMVCKRWASGIDSRIVFPILWETPDDVTTWESVLIWTYEMLLYVRFAWFVMVCLYARWELQRQSYLRTRCRQLAFQMVLVVVITKELVFFGARLYNGLAARGYYHNMLTAEDHIPFLELVIYQMYLTTVIIMYLPVSRESYNTVALYLWKRLWKRVLKQGTELEYNLNEERTGPANGPEPEECVLQQQQTHSRRELVDVAWDQVHHLMDHHKDEAHGHDLFCVETAMIMYNLAYEVYREVPDDSTLCTRPVDAADCSVSGCLKSVDSEGRHPSTEVYKAAVIRDASAAEAAASHRPSSLSRRSSAYTSVLSDNDDDAPSLLPDPVPTDDDETTGPYPSRSSGAEVQPDKDIQILLLQERVQELENLLAKADAGRASMGAVMGPTPHNSTSSRPTVRQSLSSQPCTRDMKPASGTGLRSNAGATPQGDIKTLEAVLRAKKQRKVFQSLEDTHINVQRYDYRLIGVVRADANQGLVVTGKRHVGVAFRGTCNANNVVTDLKFIKTEYKAMSESPHQPRTHVLPVCGKPQVHRGFHQAWQALRAEVLENVARAFEADPGGTPPQIYVTGHSLGGAIATLAAYDIAQDYPSHRVVLYTFGSPRVGNHSFRHIFNRAVPVCWRIVNELDGVTRVPPVQALYSHVGKKVKIDSEGLLMLEPSFLEGKYNSSKDRVASHYLSRYRKSLEGICENLEVDLPPEVMPYGFLWSLMEATDDAAFTKQIG